VINLINFPIIFSAWRAIVTMALPLHYFCCHSGFRTNIQNAYLSHHPLVSLLYRMMRPTSCCWVASDGTLRDAERHNLPRLHSRLGALRFDGALRFVNVSYFENAILN